MPIPCSIVPMLQQSLNLSNNIWDRSEWWGWNNSIPDLIHIIQLKIVIPNVKKNVISSNILVILGIIGSFNHHHIAHSSFWSSFIELFLIAHICNKSWKYFSFKKLRSIRSNPKKFDRKKKIVCNFFTVKPLTVGR